MRQAISTRHGLRRSRLLFAAATAVVAGFAGRASAQNFVGPGSNWNTGANWSTGSVPGAGSSPTIAPSTTSSFSVGYDYTGPAVKLSTLAINTPNNALVINRLNLASNALSAGTELIGVSGSGVLVQFGGTNKADFLDLGFVAGGTGGYGLSNSGVLTASQIFVGGNSAGAGGQGVLAVSGGLLTTGVTGTLTVYNTPGTGVTLSGGTISVGSLNLSGNFGLLHWTGGTLNFINPNINVDIDTAANGGNLASSLTLGAGQVLATAGEELVGSQGTGTFTQTGGSNGTDVNLELGVFSGSSGTYNLSGTGILTANEEIVGGNAAGLFNQSGGTNTVNFLDVTFNPNSTGTYLLSGGTVNAQSVSMGDGDPGVKGVLSVSGSGLMNVSGTLQAVNTTGTGITLSGGTINTAALNLNGTASLFKWTGGTLGLTAGVAFDTAAPSTSTSAAFGSSLTLGSNQTLNVTGNEQVGHAAAFSLTVNGGQNVVSGLLTVDTAIGTSTYTLSNGGSLATNGQDAFGVSEYIGFNGAAIFNQSGGTNTVSGEMDLGEFGSATGTYLLSGGTLSAGSFEEIGFNARGTFNQTGGTNTVGNELDLGPGGVSNGTYILSGGTLASTLVEVGGSTGGAGGTGVLTVSNTGLMNVSGTLTAFNTHGSGITLSGGTINTAALDLNGTPSLLKWTSGTLGLTAGVAFDSLADTTTTGAAFGSALTLGSSQTLNVTGDEAIGEVGSFSLTVNGGQNNVSGQLNLGDASGSTGTYVLSNGGTLAGSIQENVGEGGTGIFNQSSGSNSIDGFLILANISTLSFGTYNLSGGSLAPAAGEIIGPGGHGVFNQTGGTNTFSSGFLAIGVFAGATGSFSLSGGVVTAQNAFVGGGRFGAGGSGVLTVSNSGLMNLSGTLQVFNTAGSGVTLSGGTINTAALDLNGAPSRFNWTGGTLGLTAGVTFDPSADPTTTGAAFGSSLTVGSSQTLNVTGNESLGGGSAFALTVNGGQNIVSANLTVDSTSGTSTFNLGNGGTLAVNGGDGAAISEYIGYGGAALFNQSGGTNTASAEMDIGEFGSSTATYLLSGGTLSVGNYEFDSFLGATIFNQSGGLNTVGTELEVGASDGSNGIYILSGGTLSAPNINVGGSDFFGGAGTGNFNQTGGANVVSGELNLGYNVGSTGIYILSGGKLSSPSIYVGGSSAGPGGTGVLTAKNSGQLSGVGLLQVYGSGRVNLDVPNTAVGNLTIVGNGIVNLNGALTINFGSPANDPVASVVGYLKSGFNGGAWTGTAGIISTSIVGGGPALSIGYADGNTDIGTAAGPNQIVVKYTLAGDANLDGLVNFNDLVAVVQNFNKGGSDWAHGNFLYGASTNFNDLVQVVQNFNKTLPPPSGSAVELGGTTIPLLQDIQPTVVRLPEPGALGFFAAGAAGLMCRRRRRTTPIAGGK